MQADGRERAEIHPQSAVAVEDENFALGKRDGKAETDRGAQAEGFDLNIAVARPQRIPLGGSAARGGDEQFSYRSAA